MCEPVGVPVACWSPNGEYSRYSEPARHPARRRPIRLSQNCRREIDSVTSLRLATLLHSGADILIPDGNSSPRSIRSYRSRRRHGHLAYIDVRGAREEEQARRVVQCALDNGATFFDSSPMYGEAERVLGASLEGTRDRALREVWTPSASGGRTQAERARRSSAAASTSIRSTTSSTGANNSRCSSSSRPKDASRRSARPITAGRRLASSRGDADGPHHGNPDSLQSAAA